MRDAGVDIEGHTASHRSLNARKGKTDEQYLAWLKSEIVGSKRMLEKNLGIQIKAFAYPYGLYNQTVGHDQSKQHMAAIHALPRVLAGRVLRLSVRLELQTRGKEKGAAAVAPQRWSKHIPLERTLKAAGKLPS